MPETISSDVLVAAGQLCLAAALLPLTFVATSLKLRLLAALAVVGIVGALPATTGLLDTMANGTLVGWLVAAITLPAASAAVVLGVLLALDGRRGGVRIRAGLRPSPRRAAEARNLRLRDLWRREHAKLETVNEMHRCFELATRNAQITVFYQDVDLRYRWIVNPRTALTPDGAVGLTDEDVLPEPVRALVVGHKRRALATGATQTFEVGLPGDGPQGWYRIDVVPIREDRGQPVGIVCTAIDISQSKRLDRMRTDLSRRLAETLQRFNLALRSERIMVFSQDLDLRYTWANSSETQVGSLIGRTDDDVLPPADRESIVSLKRSVIATKVPASAEIGVGEGADRRWYDLHVEPNLSQQGEVTGITCASVDITHRKRNEEQMRLVMRELTHRTKNLLAVVIAVARQTAQHTDTVDDYVPALVARLRALSAAQDLIVADDWAGVDVADLVRELLGQYVPPRSERMVVEGPPLILSPEASQNLGLAVHELAANAARFGALSNNTGTVDVRWHVAHGEDGDLLDLRWTERGGPPLSGAPSGRGFGMTVIERNLARALGASVDFSFDEKGLAVRITLPLRDILPFATPDRVRLAAAS